MKIAHIGDIHISDSRITEFEVLLNQLAEEIKRNSPDLIICVGDLFIHRDRLSPKQVELARKFFKESLADIPCEIITGNHDVSMSVEKIDSLSAIFTSDFIIRTTIGQHLDIQDYRFHFFPYPNKQELSRLGVQDVAELNMLAPTLFKLNPKLKNILVFHGVMEDFTLHGDYSASEELINIGKEVVITQDFYNKFDAVMAGHLHKYQKHNKAVYCGAPFPLTFADSYSTGFVIWEDLEPRFVALKQLYPYLTFDVGDLSFYAGMATSEASRRLENNEDYTNSRIRIKYQIYQTQAGTINHTELAKHFSNAKEIKIEPTYLTDNLETTVSFEDFKQHSIYDIISKYIDDQKYHPDVKEVAKKIESSIREKVAQEDERGIHFRVQKVKFYNFKCFGKGLIEIDFDSLSPVIGIFGKNKAGKSSLVEVLSWGLFGQTMRNKDVKSIIRNGEAEVSVEMEFTSYGQDYKICRVRTNTGHSLKFFYRNVQGEWADISGSTSHQTQKQIEKIVGTFEMFSSISYSPQNNIDAIIKKKPGERKQLILDCLQVDVLNRRQEEIAELKKQTKDLISHEKGRLEAYSDQISSLIASNPEQRIKDLENILSSLTEQHIKNTSHLTTLSKKLYEYDSLNGELSLIKEEMNKKQTAILELNQRIAVKKQEQAKLEAAIQDSSLIEQGLQKISNITNSIAELEKKKTLLLELQKRQDEFRRKKIEINSSHTKSLNLLYAAKKSANNILINLKLLDCPKEDCPLNTQIKTQHENVLLEIDKIETQITEELEKHSREMSDFSLLEQQLENEISAVNYSQKEHIELLQTLEKERQNKWEELKNTISSGSTLISSILELIAALENQKQTLNDERMELVNRQAEISTKISIIYKYRQEVDKVKAMVDADSNRINEVNNQIFKCRAEISQIAKLQTDSVEVRNKLKSLEEYLNHCSKYAEIVGKQGVIYSIVDKAIPILEKFAQDLLIETTQGALSILIDSYKTLSSGDKSDEVAIYISDAKGKRDVSEASGAELVLVSLSLRAAMAHLLSMRMGSKVELFILDEGFGALDEENVLNIKSLIKILGTKFNKVLFITHVAELKDIAQSVIQVESDGLVSTLNILNK